MRQAYSQGDSMFRLCREARILRAYGYHGSSLQLDHSVCGGRDHVDDGGPAACPPVSTTPRPGRVNVCGWPELEGCRHDAVMEEKHPTGITEHKREMNRFP